MKISDVEKRTGLSTKAIRMYEERGLIAVAREENSYRNYDDDTVERLERIKQFRDAGVSLSSICLYFSGIISLEELVNERLDQIQTASSINNEQLRKCQSLLTKTCSQMDSGERMTVKSDYEVAAGIDIGTTNISAILIDVVHKRVLETYTVANHSKISAKSGFMEFNADWVLNKVRQLIDYFCERCKVVHCIGFTGQMHGIVLVDEHGAAVTPFYNWQDQRGNELSGRSTYCAEACLKSGHALHTGYGFATLYYNQCRGLIPKEAVSFTTIMDYAAASLAGKAEMVVHATNAASFGLFDMKNGEFDKAAAAALGLSITPPRVVDEKTVIGYYKNVPILVSIGDNQASFYGSIKDEETMLLINFGTGSQISLVTDACFTTKEGLEVRPYLGGKYLLCGSALCGGKAFEALERFFSAYVTHIGMDSGTQYTALNALTEKAYHETSALSVKTTFAGTRRDPRAKGTITGISVENFTPEALSLGVLQGMVDELYDFFAMMETDTSKAIVASGNIVQRNKAINWLLRDKFSSKVNITEHHEEAALGAAMCGAVNIGVMTHEEAKNLIVYKEET